MNSDTGTPAGESDAEVDDARSALVAALEALFEQDQRWRPVPSPGGATITRCWDDGTADTLLILSPDTAYAWREAPDGRELIRIRDTAEVVLAAAGEWTAPDGSTDVPGLGGASS
jgi:hypothetical protein